MHVDVLPFGIGEQSNVGQAKAAVVRSVFTERQFAVDLDSAGNGELAIFLHFAVGLLVELLAVAFRPPVVQIAAAVELASLIVEAMGKLMPDHHPYMPVVDRIGLL